LEDDPLRLSFFLTKRATGQQGHPEKSATFDGHGGFFESTLLEDFGYFSVTLAIWLWRKLLGANSHEHPYSWLVVSYIFLFLHILGRIFTTD
jgi:hypothetical protein